jgi:pimeloyl-ACP methyl ester carboxylesterase
VPRNWTKPESATADLRPVVAGLPICRYEKACSAGSPRSFDRITSATKTPPCFAPGGGGKGLPLLFCQHFTGTIDNWDPTITNTLAQGREVILFDNQGVGSSSGQAPDRVQAMATDPLAFVDALGLKKIDLLGFSIGGMVAQQMVLDRPKLVRHLILAGTGPEDGEGIDITGLPPPSRVLADASLSHFERQQRLFFAPTETSQAAGRQYLTGVVA